MCGHSDIIVAHNLIPKQCIIRCKDCEEVLFQSSKGINEAYDYLENNKDSYKTLMDLTCDDLNNKYNIAE